MGLQLDKSLINDFRNSINRNNYLVNKYKNIDGKNKLNIIYSAMDWLSVAVDGLKSINLEKGGLGYNHVNTINLMQYLVTIDLIYESIIQLYRVLDDTSNYPYEDSKDIFNQTEVSDDNYFKHLRAAFGTHPVNLQSIDGKKRGNTRYYASWTSSGELLGFDFVVSLYSNDALNDKNVFMGINISEINAYAESRYNLIKDFINISDNISIVHVDTMIKSEIPYHKDYYEQVQILLKENEKRFGKSYGFAYILGYLDYLIRVDWNSTQFQSFNKTIIQEYIHYLHSLIPIIKENMQQMNVIPISKGIKSYGYEFEKIDMFLGHGEHPIGEGYFFGLVKHGELPNEFFKENNFPLYRLVFDSYLHKKTKEYGKVLFTDLVPEGTFTYPTDL